MDSAPLILLAAGGTGGHLFPAEALGIELIKRGFRVRLVTDARALRYSGLFSKEMIAVVPSERGRGRSPWGLRGVGGGQGGGGMSDIGRGAIERLEPALQSRLILTQQVRDEDMARVRDVYDRLKTKAELAPFFTDLPARLAANHLIVSRSG